MAKRFEFFCPVEISKAKNASGEIVMKLGGIASTIDKDSDGEFLDPSGFDIEDFTALGVVNWHHQSSDQPKTIIGEPTKAEIRKDGFYVECELYPSSELAKQVYDLAQVMKSDSKTRRLGYSIEGSVIERGHTDKTHADYKIVKKAKITGLAITHMPKNPKTFADIIKGHTSKKINEEDEDEDLEEKSLDTSSGAPLTKESVDGSLKPTIKKGNDYKVVELKEEKMYDLIFDSFPNITIEKAEKVFDFFNKIKNKMEKSVIDNEKLTKAMEILNLGDNDENPFLEKAEGKSKKTPEEIADAVQDKMFKKPEEEEDEKGEVKEIKKSKEADLKKGKEVEKSGSDEVLGEEETLTKGIVNILRKDIKKSQEDSFAHFQALGQLVKGVLDQNELIKSQNSSIRLKNEELEKANKGIVESLEKANKALEGFGGAPRGRKSLTKANLVREKESFQKANTNEPTGNVLSKTNDYKKVLNLVDSLTFAKGGYDEEFGKAVQSFEVTKDLPANVINRIKAEANINIVD